MSKTRIKVKRTELVKVVEGRLRKLEADHKRAKTQLPAKREQWQRDVVARLEKALADAKRGKVGRDRYGQPTVALPREPAVPDGHRDRCRLEQMLKTLKIGTEDSILVDPEDVDHYFGPCEVR